MAKKKIKKRYMCKFCGSKRYIDGLFENFYHGEHYYSCKNEDMCVLKMSYNKKKNKI